MKLTLLNHLKKRFPDKPEKEIYASIMCGQVRYGGEILKVPSQKIRPDLEVEFLQKSYVSRGGDKLKGLIDQWGLDFAGKVVLDAGASTGGFTHCVLQEGASMVYAVDVGYNQLDYRLRTDSRVKVMERCNIMSLEELEPVPLWAVADLSFRSITGAAGKIISLISGKRLYALIKPQFEVVKDASFKGIVTDPAVWEEVLMAVRKQLEAEGLGIIRAAWSRVKGRKGNQEFFFEIAPLEDCPSAYEQEERIKSMLKGIPA